jgi:DNA repair exonuclease SbcCD ATPase subunit
MNISQLRRSQRHNAQDSAIGWVSTSDTLLFGLALFLVLAASLSAKLASSNAEQAKLTAEKSALLLSSEKLQQRVEQQTTSLEAIRQALEEEKSKLVELLSRMAADRKSTASIISDLRKKGSKLWKEFQKLKQELQIADQVLSDAQAEIDALKQKNAATEQLAKEHTRMAEDIAILQAKYEEALKQDQDEKSIRGELIGLKGKLDRVAILFDASESMKEGDRWNSAQKVIASWLEYLAMKECVLIVFSDNVNAYPADGTYVKLSSEDSQEQRQELLDFLSQFAPEGRTNTLAALQKAYEYEDLDTIVLFTDGSPYIGRSMDRIDTVMVDEIYELCANKKNIPINAVGLGNYFSPELSAFLLKIAELTDGTFVGR